MGQEPAYLSDELNLTEAERAEAAQADRVTPPVSVTALLQCVRKRGRIDGILESALSLPLEQYRRVESVWKHAPVPDRPKTRRQY